MKNELKVRSKIKERFATMTMYFLRRLGQLFIFLFFLPFISFTSQAFAAGGQEVFNAKCSACHTIGGGRRVGPDLSGLTDRRSGEWINKFIISPQSVISGGDAVAKALLAEYSNIMMPDQALSDSELT